jgi:hypothetical protein
MISAASNVRGAAWSAPPLRRAAGARRRACRGPLPRVAASAMDRQQLLAQQQAESRRGGGRSASMDAAHAKLEALRRDAEAAAALRQQLEERTAAAAALQRRLEELEALRRAENEAAAARFFELEEALLLAESSIVSDSGVALGGDDGGGGAAVAALMARLADKQAELEAAQQLLHEVAAGRSSAGEQVLAREADGLRAQLAQAAARASEAQAAAQVSPRCLSHPPLGQLHLLGLYRSAVCLLLGGGWEGGGRRTAPLLTRLPCWPLGGGSRR